MNAMPQTVAVVEPHEVDNLPAPPAPVSDTAALLAVIERAALDPRVDIDKMERLITMQERINAARAKQAYAAALSLMQPKLPVVERRGKITIREKAGDKVIQSTPYALWEDINEAIRPALAAHQFALTFRPGTTADGKITITGILSHAEGHSEEATVTLQHDGTGSKNSVQAVGSSLSYGKRYAAGLLLNITSRGEDDDGAAGGAGETISEEQEEELRLMIVETASDIPRFLALFGVKALAELPAAKFTEAKAKLATKKRKQDQEKANG